MTEDDEDDDDDEGAIVCFATLEFRIENEETVRSWLSIKPLCL